MRHERAFQLPGLGARLAVFLNPAPVSIGLYADDKATGANACRTQKKGTLNP